MRLLSHIFLALVALGGTSAASHAGAQALSARDDFGRTVQLAAPAQRIVSLSPHLTELLFAAGAGARVVGVVKHSDYPGAARNLPQIGAEGAFSLEAILAARPDLVVAWPSAASQPTIERLAALGVAVFRSEPRELEDIARTLETLGRLAGAREAAGRAALAFRQRAARLAKRYAGQPPVRIAYLIWSRPLMTLAGGQIVTKAMRLCGGENVFADLRTLAPVIDHEALLRADPEAILASGLGEELPPWVAELRALTNLTAVRRGNLLAIPEDLLQRHTPRILDGAERLCQLLESVRARRP